MPRRRPSSRSTSARSRTSASQPRTTREINAEKSRQRRHAAQQGGGTQRREKSRDTGKEMTAQKASRSFSVGGVDISMRLLVTGIAVAILAFMLVPNLYSWWQQERELTRITQQVAQQRQANEDMTRQLQLWDDPDYISTQARERLGYVRPGETQYTVVDPGPQYQDAAMAAAAAPTGPMRPWVQQLGILVGKADQPITTTPIPSAQSSAQSGDGAVSDEQSESGQ